eukprot:TRINITY_DN16507_c0_g1_i2.p1 TRINITY_DN16507_c0_g1~~TRINITY_DN16507_c0_g1_i2.p1  ORF type:complete len:110 (+),score=0.07 TRINITY_DN16507_c0_g1_i2:99-428(+)
MVMTLLTKTRMSLMIGSRRMRKCCLTCISQSNGTTTVAVAVSAATIHTRLPQLTLTTVAVAVSATIIHTRLPQLTLTTVAVAVSATIIHIRLPQLTLTVQEVEMAMDRA